MIIRENIYLEELEKIFDSNNKGYVADKTCIYKDKFLKLVAIEENIVLGYVTLMFGDGFIEEEGIPLNLQVNDKCVYIWSCITKKGYENRGVMSYLFDYIIDKYSDNDFYSIIEVNNINSIKLHQKFNFELIEEFSMMHNNKYKKFYLTKRSAIRKGTN